MLKRPLLALCTLALAGCGTPEVRTARTADTMDRTRMSWHWITQADVARLHLEHPPTVQGSTQPVAIRNEPGLTERVKERFERQLKRRGFLRARELNPDIYVTFYAKAKDQPWLSSWEGSTPGTGAVPLLPFPDQDPTVARRHEDGTLYVTVIDGRSLKTIYTAWVQDPEFGPQFAQSRIYPAARDLVDQLSSDLRFPLSMWASAP